MSVSVIVRVRDEADALGDCLGLLARQEGAGTDAQLIVVDNGSRDGSRQVAASAGAEVVTLAREHFSFGGALNLGAARAEGELCVALSAHAYVRDPGWLDRLVGICTDPLVAAVSGERFWPDGSALRGPVRLTPGLVRGYPRWGYSNAAGGFRTALWRRRPFREDLPGAEDKEWARFWALGEGLVTVLDPGLEVEHDHTHDPLAQIFTRARREAAAYAMFLAPEEDPRQALLSEWLWDTRHYLNPWRARLSPRRAARLLGDHLGGHGARTGADRHHMGM